MRYLDYMNEFSLLNETKVLLNRRMQQRARQLKAAEGARAYQAATAAQSEPKKRSTFRLHPRRWIAIAVSAALVLAAIPTVYFTAFWGGSENWGLDPIKLEYMENMMVETEGVTAYSIRQETEEVPAAPLSRQTGGEGAALSLLSATVITDEAGVRPLAAEKKTRNYLYSTNESYELGNVEYDEKGITRVTFKKNSEVTEDVYDNNGKLIDSERKITQEELDSQINKIYTTKEFTFIQFVPMVEKSGWYSYQTADGKWNGEYVYLRPEGMTYDEQGVADFDKGIPTGNEFQTGYDRSFPLSYYTSPLSASFVIDNATGYIYKIENLRIDGFQNGLIKSYVPRDQFGTFDYGSFGQANYYSLSVDEEHNLVFTDVLPNKDIEINNVYYDKYDWLYVLNNRIDDIDVARKVVYTTDRYKYVHDEMKNVYVTNSIDWYEDTKSWGETPPALVKRMVNGEEVALAADDVVGNLKYLWRDYNSDESGHEGVLIGRWKNLSVWKQPLEKHIYHEGYYEGGNDEEGGAYVDGWTEYQYIVAYDNVTDSGLSLSGDIMDVPDNDRYAASVRWLDSNYDFILVHTKGRLSYAKVNLDDCLTTVKTLATEDFSPLSELTLFEAEDYYLPVGSDKYKINDVFYCVDTNETKYFHIVKTTTGLELVELTSKSYSDNVFIFQPINK